MVWYGMVWFGVVWYGKVSTIIQYRYFYIIVSHNGLNYASKHTWVESTHPVANVIFFAWCLRVNSQSRHCTVNQVVG